MVLRFDLETFAKPVPGPQKCVKELPLSGERQALPLPLDVENLLPFTASQRAPIPTAVFRVLGYFGDDPQQLRWRKLGYANSPAVGNAKSSDCKMAAMSIWLSVPKIRVLLNVWGLISWPLIFGNPHLAATHRAEFQRLAGYL